MNQAQTFREFEVEDRLRSFARLITRDFSLKVVFGGEEAYLTSQRMQIPPVENTPEAFCRAKFYVSHECGHALHSDFSVMRQAKEEDSRLPSILNSLEDARVERLMIKEFSGLEKNIDQNTHQIIAYWEIEDMPLATQLIYGMYLTGRDYDVTFFNSCVQNILKELTSEIKKASQAESCSQVLVQAREILTKIDQIIKPPPQAKVSILPQLSPQAKEELKEADFAEASISELIKEHFDEVKLEQDTYKVVDYQLFLDENNPEEKTIIYPSSGDLSQYMQVFNPLRVEYNYLRLEIRKIVSQKRVKKRRLSYVRRQKQGTVDTKNLWKIATSEDKLFKKRQQTKSKSVEADNLAVYLLLDESASMHDFNRYLAAQKAVIVLSETLDSLSIPFALTGYTTNNEGIARYSYKEFADKYSAVRTRTTSIDYRGGTFTAENLPFAQRRLERRLEQKKLLVVITDSESIESEYRLKREINCLENANIEVVGIGIHTNLMSEYYHKFIEIKDLKGFGGKLLKLLKKVLTK